MKKDISIIEMSFLDVSGIHAASHFIGNHDYFRR